MRTWSLLALVACGSDPAGSWVLTDADFTVNDCQLDGNLLPTENVTITADSLAMEIDFHDGYPEIECTRDGSRFTCPEVDVFTERQRDALLTTRLATEGTTGKTLELTRTGSITCQGADCPTIEGLSGVRYPCAIAFDVAAARGQD